MANINAITKRKQIMLASSVALIVVAGGAGGWYLSTMDQRNAAKAAQSEPAPDMTGVVNAQFDDKVQQSAVTEFQLINKEVRQQLAAMRTEMAMMSRERKNDQERLALLEAENKELKAATASGPSLQAPTGEPAPSSANPAQMANGDIPPPTAFYPGMGNVQPGQMTIQPMAPVQPVNAIDSTTFSYDDDQPSQAPRYPYIPSGSFAKAVVIEGADTNAAVTGQQNTSPMQLRLTGKVQMPNDHEYDLTGCFVTLEAWGDVSSERAIVRTRGISCKKSNDVIDQKIAGHVSFMGKNGIKGEVIMRNGQILGWAWGAGFIDGVGKGIEKSASPQVGIGATATMNGGDIAKAGIGGGAGQAAKTLSDYYIKRAEQYHPIIPIGAGNEVTMVFQDGFQLETIAEAALKKANKAPVPQQDDVLADPTVARSFKDMKVGDLVDPPLHQ